MLDPGRNCDPLANADRFAVLVDGSNYYAALAQSIERARHTMVLVGWDLDTRVSLAPGPDGTPIVPPLREFLPAVAARNPDLNIYISTWDFSILFATVRDPALALGRNPFNHPRVHLTFDTMVPLTKGADGCVEPTSSRHRCDRAECGQRISLWVSVPLWPMATSSGRYRADLIDPYYFSSR